MRGTRPVAMAFFLLITAGPVAAQCSPGRGRIWIGPPANPEKYVRFATDNGIPGSGSYAYTDYNWPSLREALNQYGLFGRRFRRQKYNEIKTPIPYDNPTPEESPLLNPPRKLGDGH